MCKDDGTGSFRRCDYGGSAKCCGCQEHQTLCQMSLQVAAKMGTGLTIFSLFVFCSTTRGKAAVIAVEGADRTLRTARAVPLSATNRAPCPGPTRSAAFDTVWLSATKMNAGLIILSLSLSVAVGSATLSKAAILTMAKADSTVGTSRAVPQPKTSRALCRLTSEVLQSPAPQAVGLIHWATGPVELR
jgi:hypothetical protein